MSDSYYLDLAQFSLGRLREMLETGEVLPSRRILCDDLAQNFARLEALGIANVQQLVEALSSKKKVETFAQQSGLTVEYLTILGRQARSYVPTPAELGAIPGVDPAHVARLAESGIRNTRQLWERARSRADRAALVEQSGLPAEALIELVRLADICRAGFVGPIYARLLYAAGVDSLATLAQQDAQALFEQMGAVNALHHYTKAWFTVKDVIATIDTARQLPKVIEF